MGQDATRYTEVGLGYIMLDGNLAPLIAPNFLPMSVVAKRLNGL